MKISLEELKHIIKRILNEEMQHLNINDFNIDILNPQEKDPENIPDKYKKFGGFHEEFTKEFEIDQHENMIVFSFDEPTLSATDSVNMYSVSRNSLQDGIFKDIVNEYPNKKIFFLNLAEYTKIAENFKIQLDDVLNPFYVMHDFGHASFGRNFLETLKKHGDFSHVIQGYADDVNAELRRYKKPKDLLDIKFYNKIPENFPNSTIPFILVTYIISKLLQLDLPEPNETGPQDKLPNIIMHISNKHKDKKNQYKILKKIEGITAEKYKNELVKIVSTGDNPLKGIDISPYISEIKNYLKKFYLELKTNFEDHNLVSFIGIKPNIVEITMDDDQDQEENTDELFLNSIDDLFESIYEQIKLLKI